jgi:hypothetical protein
VAVVDVSAGSGLQQGGQWRSFLRDLPVEPCKVQLFCFNGTAHVVG